MSTSSERSEPRSAPDAARVQEAVERLEDAAANPDSHLDETLVDAADLRTVLDALAEAQRDADFMGAPYFEALKRMKAAEARARVLASAIRAAMSNLGVPGDGYPAPVAEAYSILAAALSTDAAAALDGGTDA